ncbi:MAG: twin-arginine translocase TatA/TatE family subunit [Dehalococcoidia bacterium]|nr:twin-arginine translocase TatA/TatE family subunit [Dehalococcoidia bacterium]
MNMFGIGLPEVVVVAVIAVIVLGPERMPAVAVQIARAIKYLRGYATDATAQMRGELSELTKEYEEVRRELHDFRESVRKDISSVVKDVERAAAAAQPIVEPGGEPPPKRPQAGGQGAS